MAEPEAPARDTPPRAAPRRRLRRALLGVVVLAAAALAAVVLVNSGDELLAAADTLTSVNLVWVAVAVLAEVVSYGARGAAEVVVLRQGREAPGGPDGTDGTGGADGTGGPGVVVLSAATWAGDAAAYCLPFGFAASGVVTVRALTRRGVGAAVATWMFTVSQMFYIGSVAVLTLVAVEIAGDQDPIPGLAPASIGLVVVLAAVGVVAVVARRSATARAAIRSVRDVVTRRGVRERGRLGRWWDAQREQLRAVRLSWSAGLGAFAWMTVSWLADIAVLGIAYAALGAGPPWVGLLLAYCAGQVAAAVPVTPGGIGAVEGSLTLALVAFGGAQTVTLAAVLLYRLIAYWGCIPVGGLAWLGLRATAGSAAVSTTAPAPAPVDGDPA